MMIRRFKNISFESYKDFDAKRLRNGWNVTSVYRTATGNNMDGYHVIYEDVYTKGIDISSKKPLDAF